MCTECTVYLSSVHGKYVKKVKVYQLNCFTWGIAATNRALRARAAEILTFSVHQTVHEPCTESVKPCTDLLIAERIGQVVRIEVMRADLFHRACWLCVYGDGRVCASTVANV